MFLIFHLLLLAHVSCTPCRDGRARTDIYYRLRSLRTSQQEAARLPYTTCTAELYDEIADTTAYKLRDVLLSEGQYRLSVRPLGLEADINSNLPEGVHDSLRPAPGRVDPTCPAEKRKVVLVPHWKGDHNMYHNFVFFLRQIVQSMIAAWGADLLTAKQEPIFYGFYSVDGAAYLSVPDTVQFYKAFDVFFTGAYLQEAQSSCAFLQNALLVSRIKFYSKRYDTQQGKALEIETLVYRITRDRYIRELAGDQANAFQAREDSPVRVLYLARPDFDTRHILNEADMLKALHAYAKVTKGMKLLVRNDFEAAKFLEQVAILASTDILIGPHGAGLTNVLFMKPQSVLIELIPNGWADPGYRNLAIFSGKVYMFWQQTNQSLSESLVIRDGAIKNLGRSNNFHVNAGEVVSILKAAVNIVSNVGSRWWPDCPGHEFLDYRRAAPIRCAKLWKRDDGVLVDTPPDRML